MNSNDDFVYNRYLDYDNSSATKTLHFGKSHEDSDKGLLNQISAFIKEIFEQLFKISWCKEWVNASIIRPVSSGIDHCIANTSKKFNECFFDLSAPSNIDGTSILPIGLPNIGNSCYLNSVVQMLLSMEVDDLEAFLSSIENTKLRSAFKEVFNAMKLKNTTTKSLIPLMTKLRDTLFDLGVNYFQQNNLTGQQDAHELLSVILQNLLIKFNRIKIADETASVKFKPNVKSEMLSMISLPMVPPKNYTWYNWYENWIQPKFLKSKNPFALNNCLDRCFNEKMSGPDTAMNFSTESGQSRKVSDYTNQFRLDGAPPKYLFLHIVRQDFSWGYASKIHTALDLPEQIDFSDFASNKIQTIYKDQLLYEPVSVIQHHGHSPDSGHYTASVKRKDAWYNCNDTSIKNTRFNSIDNKNSYIVMLKSVKK